MNAHSALIELDNLTKAVDLINRSQAEQLLNLMNAKLHEILQANIIDILWKKEGRFGDLLMPVVSLNKSHRGKVAGFQITEDMHSIWSYIYYEGKYVWLEGIKSRDVRQPMRNLAEDETISPDYLEFHYETDSLIAVPLIFHDLPWGLYSVELPFSNKLGHLVLDLITKFAQNISTILWKVDAYETNTAQTLEAINSLSEFLRATDFHEFLRPTKTAFMARPFTPECEAVQTAINEALQRKHSHIEVRHVIPEVSYVLDEIIKQIQSCIFGIVDITGCKPNVVMELGMMVSLRKPFLIFRRADDTADLPFNVGHYPFHRYEFRDGTVKIIDPGTTRLEPIDTVLEPLLR